MEELLQKYQSEFIVTFVKTEIYSNFSYYPSQKIYTIGPNKENNVFATLHLPTDEQEHQKQMDEARKLYAIKRVMFEALKTKNLQLQKQIAIHCFIHHPHVYSMLNNKDTKCVVKHFLPFVLLEFDPAYVLVRISCLNGDEFDYKNQIHHWKEPKVDKLSPYLPHPSLFAKLKKRNKCLIITFTSPQGGKQELAIPLLCKFSQETKTLLDLKPAYWRVTTDIFRYGQYCEKDKWWEIIPSLPLIAKVAPMV